MKKNIKMTLFALLCCFSLSFMAPGGAFVVDAASNNGTETIQPYAEILRWVYDIRDNKVYKRLYNTSTGNWVGDWIYVRDLD